MTKVNNSSKIPLLLLGFLGVLIISTLVVVSSYFLRPTIELELRKKLTEDLSKAGMTNSVVHISGRDITLQGSVANKMEAKIIEEIAKNIWGVRQVKNNLSIE